MSKDTNNTTNTTPAEKAPRKKLETLTSDILAYELKANNFSIRLNDITYGYEVEGRSPTGRECSLDDIAQIMHDILADRYKGTAKSNLEQMLTYLGRENHYNPVIEYLDTLTWDGMDRLPALYSMMRLPESDTLSRVLIRKWLYQTVALLFNGDCEHKEQDFGAEGCLTFNSGQGYGKSQLLKHLAFQNSVWFGDGKTNNRFDKDTTRRIITHWITELGEVDGSIPGNVETLKNLITIARDEYRLPYDRADRNLPRKTSLAATCNHPEYLVDETGNRRWWTVPLQVKIPYGEIHSFDYAQLWAQIYADVKPMPYEQKAACFRLSDDEQRQLAERNAKHEKPLKGEEEIRDILELAYDKEYEFVAMSPTEFISYWKRELGNVTANQVGQVLKKLGIPPADTGRNRYLKMLPIPPTLRK